MEVTYLIGLPGSGKTTYARKLKGYVVDDPRSMKDFPDSAGHLIVADPKLCNSEMLRSLEKVLSEKYGSYEETRIYFENDLTTCLKNIEYRRLWGDEREVDSITRHLSRIYCPPPNSLKVKTNYRMKL